MTVNTARTTLPRWWNGQPIPSALSVVIWDRSPDAEYILEGKEFDLPWFFAEIAEDWLPAANVDSVVDPARRNPPIARWVQEEHAGNWQAAIRECPLLVLLSARSVNLLDGWHRLALARQAGLKCIPVCFAWA